MTKKKTIIKKPGSPVVSELALEDKLLLKSTLDTNEDEIEGMLEKLENDLTTKKLNEELKEAKKKRG